MQKISRYLVMLLLSITSLPDLSSAADTTTEPPLPTIHLTPDMQTQIRSNTPVKITKAIDATTLLADDGTIYALTGLDIPDDDTTAPRTLHRLTELTEGKTCTLYQTRNDSMGRINRMNQTLGHLTCGKDAIWIQGALIAEGLARVRTTPENAQQASMMLILESGARAAHLGLWANSRNTPLTPENAAEHINGFGLVEGRIYTVAQTRDAIFLNFSTDWKSDFTIGIPTKLRTAFSKRRIDLFTLKGKSVRVRGWIRAYNGPYIELDHVDQLEILGDSTARESAASSPTSQEPLPMMHTISGPTISKPTAPQIEKPDTPSPSPSP